MANAPRSSFIPRQVAGVTPKTIRQKRVFNIFGFFSVTLLLLSIVAAGGTFLYKNYLERQLAAEKDALQAEYDKFDEAELVSVRTFDTRLDLVAQLLENHVAPSKIFDALEAGTKQSVQYTTFSYERRPSGDITLDIMGITDEFSKVSLQWMEYLRGTLFADAVLTRVAQGVVDGAGELSEVPVFEKRINFNLIANIPASSIYYDGTRAAVRERGAPPREENTTTATSTETGAAESLDTGDEGSTEADTSTGTSTGDGT